MKVLTLNNACCLNISNDRNQLRVLNLVKVSLLYTKNIKKCYICCAALFQGHPVDHIQTILKSSKTECKVF